MRRYVDNHPVLPAALDMLTVLRSPQLLYSQPHMSLAPDGQPASAMLLSEEQIAFFDTFGYLALPGVLAEDIAWVQHEFEAVWAARTDLEHDGSKRSMFPGLFVAQSPRLSTLVEDPRVAGACRSLLGEGYTLSGGDGNFYSGDTGWHSDTQAGFGMRAKTVCRHLKIAFYLDDGLTDASGALRVIPGSHRFGDHYAEQLEAGMGALGSGPGLPAMALPTQPGDLLLFDHRLKHASFGGGPRRRMFTTNWYAGTPTPVEYDAAQEVNASYWGPNSTARPFEGTWAEGAPEPRRAILSNHEKLWAEMAEGQEAPGTFADPNVVQPTARPSL